MFNLVKDYSIEYIPDTIRPTEEKLEEMLIQEFRY